MWRFLQKVWFRIKNSLLALLKNGKRRLILNGSIPDTVATESPEIKKRKTDSDEKLPSWWWDEVFVRHQSTLSDKSDDVSQQSDNAKSKKCNSDQRKIERHQESPWLDKLRWATLGYHHNWDTKKYSLKSVSQVFHTSFAGASIPLSFCQ